MKYIWKWKCGLGSMFVASREQIENVVGKQVQVDGENIELSFKQFEIISSSPDVISFFNEQKLGFGYNPLKFTK